MLEKTLIKSILKKWDYGDFRVVFWDKEEFFIGNKPAKFSLICRRKNKISIWKNKTSIKVEILFFYKA